MAQTLLDTFQWDRPEAQRLHELLVRHLTDAEIPDRVARQLGLRGEVNLPAAPVTAWRELLDVAVRHGRLRDLVATILADHSCRVVHAALTALCCSPAAKDRRGTLPHVWNLKPPPRQFVGRASEIAALAPHAPALHVLWGMAGVGKSALVRKWAEEQGGRLCAGWWLRARDAHQMRADLDAFGVALGLHGGSGERLPDDGSGGPTGEAGGAVVEHRLARVYAWLRAPWPTPAVADPELPWLLVVDDAEDEASVELPVGPGFVVVTTRSHWVGATPIQALPEDAALDLVVTGLVGKGNDAASARAVVTALGALPQALVLANAWCRDNGFTLRRFHDRFRGLVPGAPGAAVIGTLWDSFTARLSAGARAALEILAWFEPDDIPIELVFASAPGGVSARAAALCAGGIDAAIAELHKVRLVERRDDRVDIHGLVRDAARHRLTGRREQQRRRDALLLLGAALPETADPPTWSTWLRLAPHVDAVAAAPSLDAAQILGRLGCYLWACGAFDRAELVERRALQFTLRTAPADGLDVALRMANLAETIASGGGLVEARSLQERALEISEARLPPGDLSLAIRAGNLAATLSLLGDNGAALALERRALAIVEAVHPPEHEAVGRRLANLAATLASMGHLAESRELNLRALAIARSQHGERHVSTGIREGNLASVEAELGELASARDRMKRAVAILRSAVGAEHPTTRHYVGRLAALPAHEDSGASGRSPS